MQVPIRRRGDQRRMALVFSANDRFANSFGEGTPLRSAIGTILERRAPSRSAVALWSPAHLPQVFHQPATQV